MKRVILFVMTIFFMGSCTDDPTVTTDRFKEIESKAQFDNVISSGVSLMMFHSPGCSICNALKPVIDAAANEEDLKAAQFFLVDVTQHQDITAAHNVRGYPITVIFKDNVEVERLAGGNHSIEKIKDLVKSHL